MTSTSQQIRFIQRLQDRSYEYMLLEIRRIVDNAVIASGNGDGYPLEQLRKIAAMDVPVSNYIQELRNALGRAEHGAV
jgi:hypothetical protein